MVVEYLAPFSGVIWGALGYAIKHAKDKDKFDPKDFFITVGIGLGLYGIAMGAGQPVATVEGYTTLQLLTVLFDKLASFWHK